MNVHYIDDQHWSGWCDSNSGQGTTLLAEVTCADCLAGTLRERLRAVELVLDRWETLPGYTADTRFRTMLRTALEGRGPS